MKPPAAVPFPFPLRVPGHAPLRIGTLCCARRYNYFIVKHGVNTLFPYKLPEVIVSNATNAANITNVTFTETFDLVRACGPLMPALTSNPAGGAAGPLLHQHSGGPRRAAVQGLDAHLLCTSRKLCFLMTHDRLLQLQLLAVRFGC